ncbi:putative ppe family protein [Erysiphe neolycopersici]|uniref:Putative ppe family protein n=1 Tax=Erysiphe neolycopersici TaxID=212602 RepID=A0A420HUD3_9PEZI|nr:putative ppe family protein [Erysiphe neolycopersici]
MHYFQILSFLACAQVAIANPISLQARAKSASQSSKSSQSTQSTKATQLYDNPGKLNANDPTQDSVRRAADNFAQDAGIVSNAINVMTSMTDQDAIKDTAMRAFKAESDEDKQRAVLAAAAGKAGATPNRKIQQFTPTVLDGLDAIAKDPSPDSVASNTKMMEDARNPNILPSITDLSNAALDAMGLDKSAQNLQKTVGQSGTGGGSTDRGTGAVDASTSTNNTNNTNNNASTKSTNSANNDDDSTNSKSSNSSSNTKTSKSGSSSMTNKGTTLK